MRRLPFIALLAVMAAVITGCTSRGDFSRFADMPAEGWVYGDTVKFDTGRDDSITPGRLSVALRHNNDYEFSNLWLEVRYTNRGHLMIDTINLQLADDYGRWLGEGFGATRQGEKTIATDVLPDPRHDISVRHIMRVDTLHGIEAVGILFHATRNQQSSK